MIPHYPKQLRHHTSGFVFVKVEHVGRNSIRLRLPYNSAFMGAEPWQDGSGQVFSGPVVMGFADTAMYCCVMAALGAEVIPVMANLTITFLRPARASDLIAEARIVRRGSRLSYLECWLKSDGETEPCAHITSTYRVAKRSMEEASCGAAFPDGYITSAHAWR
jgi:uncharacterized protein (TIGR00369 family)